MKNQNQLAFSKGSSGKASTPIRRATHRYVVTFKECEAEKGSLVRTSKFSYFDKDEVDRFHVLRMAMLDNGTTEKQSTWSKFTDFLMRS